MKLPRGATEAGLVVALLLGFQWLARPPAPPHPSLEPPQFSPVPPPPRSIPPVPGGVAVTPLEGADLALGRKLLAQYALHMDAATRDDAHAYMSTEAGEYRGNLFNYMKLDRESPHMHPAGFQIYDARQQRNVARLVLVRPAAEPRNSGVLSLGFVSRATSQGQVWLRLPNSAYALQGDHPPDPDQGLPWESLDQGP